MAWPINNNNNNNDGASSPSKTFEDEFVPFERMSDSESYLNRLEHRLAKLKSAPLSSKAILQGLLTLKESSHLETGSADNSFVIQDTNDVFSLERRLFPSKCVLNIEEAQKLLDADILAQATQRLEGEKEQETDIPR